MEQLEPIVISDESDVDIHQVQDVRELLSDTREGSRGYESVADSIDGYVGSEWKGFGW